VVSFDHMYVQVAAPGVKPQIPWLVLTSDATDVPTRAFFEENSYFGLDESQVILSFCQNIVNPVLALHCN
jgi:UDP-N-acetylglucosamine pyrophosphorylase